VSACGRVGECCPSPASPYRPGGGARLHEGDLEEAHARKVGLARVAARRLLGLGPPGHALPGRAQGPPEVSALCLGHLQRRGALAMGAPCPLSCPARPPPARSHGAPGQPVPLHQRLLLLRRLALQPVAEEGELLRQEPPPVLLRHRVCKGAAREARLGWYGRGWKNCFSRAHRRAVKCGADRVLRAKPHQQVSRCTPSAARGSVPAAPCPSLHGCAPCRSP